MPISEITAITQYVNEKDAVARVEDFERYFTEETTTISPATLNVVATLPNNQRYTSADFGRYMMMYINDLANRETFFDAVFAYAKTALETFKTAAEAEVAALDLKGPPVPIIVSPAEVTAVYAQPFEYKIIAANMIEEFSPSYATGAVPDGLTFDPATGIMSGQVESSSTVYSFNVWARNMYGEDRLQITIRTVAE